MISQIIINGITAGLLWGLVAIGFSLIYSTARFLHAAHAATFIIGAYTGIWMAKYSGGSFIAGALIALIAAAILGGLIEISIYRPMRRVNSSPLILFLASLALVIIIQNAITLIWGSDIQVVRESVERDALHLLGGRITFWQLVSSIITLLIFIIVWLSVRLTRAGKMLRAVATDPDLAQIVGIDRNIILLTSMCLGSAMAGISGFLFSYETALTPSGGLRVLLIGATAAIVGGIGSVPGAMLGGLLIGIVQHIGVWYLPTQWQDTIVFLILILFLLLRPQGFFGLPIRKATV